jgi:Flp pilus assembly protein TadG
LRWVRWLQRGCRGCFFDRGDWVIRRRAGWNGEAGAALVEFAIALPILLLIVWCIVDFARAYYTINSLATAVREGARYAAVQVSPAASGAAIKTRVKDAFNAFGGDSILDAQINVYDSTASKGNVTVQVKDYSWLTTTPINIIAGGQIKMTRQSTFRWERAPTI